MALPYFSRHSQTSRDELLAAEGVAVRALLGQLALDHVLGGDPGVVGAGHPEHVVALHAPVAAEDVLEGVVEGMAHVQDAGDVGRRDDDGVAAARALAPRRRTGRFLPRSRTSGARHRAAHSPCPAGGRSCGDVSSVSVPALRPPRAARRVWEACASTIAAAARSAPCDRPVFISRMVRLFKRCRGVGAAGDPAAARGARGYRGAAVQGASSSSSSCFKRSISRVTAVSMARRIVASIVPPSLRSITRSTAASISSGGMRAG